MTRMWRSRKVAWLVALLAFALVAAACGGDDTEGDTTTTTPPDVTTTVAAPGGDTTTTVAETTTTAPPTAGGKTYGGDAVVGDTQEPPTLNPYVPGGDNFIVAIVGQGYYTGVQEVDGFTLELLPEVVTELPTVENGAVVLNDDGTMTVTYDIREEAVWSDGTPISGADFQFTLDTILDPDLPVDKATYDQIVDTEVGDKSFTYTLAAPTTGYELLFGLTHPLIPAHAVEGSDFVTDWNDAPWPSAGPFVFDSWQKGETITLTRNDNYWKTDEETGDQLPYLDSVTFRFIPETESLINAFRAREIDAFNPPPGTDVIETLQALEPEGAVVEVLSGPIWEHLAFSFAESRFERNAESMNANITYRQAVAHAIDRQVVVDELLAGQVEPMDSFVEAYAPALSQGAWAQYNYDPELASDLVEQVKEEEGVDAVSTVFTTTSNNDARVQLSELFGDMFAAVGIDYVADLEDSELFFGETTVNGNYDLGEWAWVGTPGFSGLVDLMDLFDPNNPPPEGQNYYYFGAEGSALVNENSERFAEIRTELNTSVDEDVLIPLIAEAENILADELVIIPLYARLDIGAVWGDEIGGFKHNPTLAGLTWNIEEWHRVDQ